MSYHVVVAKYLEDVAWTRDLENVIVYDKSPNPIPGSIPLQNIGREGETWLRYIIDHYETLPEYVVFLQGNPFTTMWRGMSVQQGLGKPQSAQPFAAPLMKEPIAQYPGMRFSEYYFLLFGQLYSDQTIPVAYGAQWSVPRHCITHRPIEFYRKIHRMIIRGEGVVSIEDLHKGPGLFDKNIINGWTLERLWSAIFDPCVPTAPQFVSKYDLVHLNQDPSQKVTGPIQDDEALFMYSLIRGNRMERVLEVGALFGYSGRNFLAALEYTPKGKLYSLDLYPPPILGTNHKTIIKDIALLEPSDVDNLPLDLVFFDCHCEAQKDAFLNLVKWGLVTNETVVALHDTNLHFDPWTHPSASHCERTEGGVVHQPVEREMRRWFKELGYQVFSIRTTRDKHSADFPWRHGLTVCQKF